MSSSEVRVRRPKNHESLVQQLREEGGFPTFRDILLYAAALGRFQQRSIAFDESAEPIRFETMTDPAYSATLVNMLAATEREEDAEVLASARLAERVAIFETFVNGGLEYLQEQINVRQQPIDIVVEALVTEALTDSATAQPADVSVLLEGRW